MRLASPLASLTALLALALASVDGVATCGECPSDKTCLLADEAYSLGAAQSSLQLKFCNFDAAKSYALSFALQKPLACDPSNALMPVVASLKAQDGCAPTNCVVTATLKSTIDWAVLLQNGAEPSVLQASITAPNGKDELVRIAKGLAAAGTDGVQGDGDSATKATVCTTAFGVKASRLSTLGACNKVTLCTGKPSDTGCTTPVTTATAPIVDKVTCTADACTGTMTLDGGLPCSAVSSSLIVNVAVGNSAASPFKPIATIAAAPVAKISGASGATVGSKTVTLTSDATCAKAATNVTVDGLQISDFTTSNGTTVVTLASVLTETQDGSNLDVSIMQCGVASSDYMAKVGKAGSESLVTSTTSSSKASGNVGDPERTGSQSTQKENADTGLPGALYIAIGVGVLAFIGFAYECIYHRKRHRKEHGNGNGGGPVADVRAV